MPRQRKKDDAAVRDERLNDPSLVKAARLLGQLADKQCGPTARSRAARRVAAALLSSFQEDTDADEREDSEG